MGAFICQLSEEDWKVSREIGVYGNREGSKKEDGSVAYFVGQPRGMNVIQSIIEDIIGMRQGDQIFFHVLRGEGSELGLESSIHGAYMATGGTYYDMERIWASSSDLCYPYRFAFKPHPSHLELCKADVSIPVSQFYNSVESRRIDSIFTLEREVRGSAHAVKKITMKDADELVKLLYGNFSPKFSICFNGSQISNKLSLRSKIERIGSLEFSIKALVTYLLANNDSRITSAIPSCCDKNFEFLIECFMGQTARKPADILVLSENLKMISVVEAKTDVSKLEDLIQALRYIDIFSIRKELNGEVWQGSVCLLAKRFDAKLQHYVALRNLIFKSQPTILLKYVPMSDGKDARFQTENNSSLSSAESQSKVSNIIMNQIGKASQHETPFYSIFPKITPTPKTIVELESKAKDRLVFGKFLQTAKRENIMLSKILVANLNENCTLEDVSAVMTDAKKVAWDMRRDMSSVETFIIASAFDPNVRLFIKTYNDVESLIGRQPIRLYSFV